MIFEKQVFNSRLHSGIYELFSFKLGMVVRNVRVWVFLGVGVGGLFGGVFFVFFFFFFCILMIRTFFKVTGARESQKYSTQLFCKLLSHLSNLDFHLRSWEHEKLKLLHIFSSKFSNVNQMQHDI